MPPYATHLRLEKIIHSIDITKLGAKRDHQELLHLVTFVCTHVTHAVLFEEKSEVHQGER